MTVPRLKWASVLGLLALCASISGSLATRADFCREYELENEGVYYCYNGGTCRNTESGRECTCLSGYKGEQCDLDIDECFANEGICMNGATCVNKFGSYECLCTHGFTGKHCEINIDDCTNHNCHPNAICVDQVDSYRCECPPGRFGDECEKEDLCYTQDPCFHGNCSMHHSGRYMCECEPGFVGYRCDKDLNECLWDPCRNGGRCENTVGSYKCHCAPGFTGTDCENIINHCDSNPCKNAGSCLNQRDGFKCICMPGFDGPSCETRLDTSCNLDCKHGGVCYMGKYCSCPPAFKGELCEIAKPDPCAGHEYCGRNGLCFATGDYKDFYCECLPGYRGEHCEIQECIQGDCIASIDFCATDHIDCSGHGECKNLENGYRCKCEDGFEGKDCSSYSINDDSNTLLSGDLVLALTGPKDIVVGQLNQILLSIGHVLRVLVRVHVDKNGHPIIYHWTPEHGKGPLVNTTGIIDTHDSSMVYDRRKPHGAIATYHHVQKRSIEPADTIEGFLMFLRFDIAPCLADKRLNGSITCPEDIFEVAAELLRNPELTKVLGSLGVKIEKAQGENAQSTSLVKSVILCLAGFFMLLLVGVGVLTIKKKKPVYRDRNIVTAKTYWPPKASDQASSIFGSALSLNCPQQPGYFKGFVTTSTTTSIGSSTANANNYAPVPNAFYAPSAIPAPHQSNPQLATNNDHDPTSLSALHQTIKEASDETVVDEVQKLLDQGADGVRVNVNSVDSREKDSRV